MPFLNSDIIPVCNLEFHVTPLTQSRVYLTTKYAQDLEKYGNENQSPYLVLLHDSWGLLKLFNPLGAQGTRPSTLH